MLHDISFTLAAGDTLAIIGPSGSGKTTLLKHLNKMIEPYMGSIEVFGEDLAATDPIELRRRIGYVIQRGGLFPHYTVQQNITLVPQLLKWEKKRRRARAEELLALVDLPLDYLERYPASLSGGEQQRVGIARALAADPKLVLLDEPFSALDPITRNQLQQSFLDLKARLNTTFVLVTHDLEEAFKLADQTMILKDGVVQQIGSREELERQPANAFVTEFIQQHVS